MKKFVKVCLHLSYNTPQNNSFHIDEIFSTKIFLRKKSREKIRECLFKLHSAELLSI